MTRVAPTYANGSFALVQEPEQINEFAPPFATSDRLRFERAGVPEAKARAEGEE
ncbi:MAG: hypothetical protein ACRDJ9_21855 [Dehalococcoidia bacterium]